MTAQALSRKEAARRLGCSDSTFYTLVKSGRLTARKLLGSTVVMADEIERFLSALPVAEMGKSPLKGKPLPPAQVQAMRQSRRKRAGSAA